MQYRLSATAVSHRDNVRDRTVQVKSTSDYRITEMYILLAQIYVRQGLSRAAQRGSRGPHVD